jgi:glycosyltransferase involved in cell wall biosynthesis
VEALSCGLPAVYLDSGGSREAVKEAGFAFTDREQIPDLLDRLVDEYEERQAAISLPSLEEIVDQYLDALGLDEFVGRRGDG